MNQLIVTHMITVCILMRVNQVLPFLGAHDGNISFIKTH
jgi:hypothetical protein